MGVTEIQLYKALKEKLGDAAAQEMINFIKSEVNSEFMDCKQVFLTKDDKVELINTSNNMKAELMRAIYIVNIIQFLAIIGSLIGIMSFFMKH